MDVNFTVRDDKYLQVSFTNEHGRQRIALGSFPPTIKFSKEKCLFVGQSTHTTIWNVKIQKVRAAVMEHFNSPTVAEVVKDAADIERGTGTSLLELFREYIADYEMGLIKGTPTAGTVGTMITALNCYRKYAKRAGSIKIPGNTADLRKHLTGWLNWMVDAGLARNTQANYAQKMRQFLRHVQKETGAPIWHDIYIPLISKEIVILPPATVEKFLKLEHDFRDPERQGVFLLAKVMICGCMAFREAVTLAESLPKEYVELMRGKSNRENKRPCFHRFYIPRRISAQIAEFKRANGSILPASFYEMQYARQNDTFNSHLKEIFYIFDSTHQKVTVLKQRPDGRMEQETAPLLSHITSHILRKSGASYYFSKGVSPEEIKAIGAWSKRSTIPWLYYIKIEVEKSRSVMESIFK